MSQMNSPRNPSTSSTTMDNVLVETLNMDAEQFDRPSFGLSQDDSIFGDTFDGLTSASFPTLFDPFSNPYQFYPAPSLVPHDLPPLKPTGNHSNKPSAFSKIELGELYCSGINVWSSDASEAGGYIEGHDFNVLSGIKESRFSSACSAHVLTDKRRKNNLALCRPAADPSGTNIVLVGSATANATKHVLMALDTTPLYRTSNPDPDQILQGITTTQNHIQEIHWLSNNRVFVANGTQSTLYTVDDLYNLRENCQLKWAHTDEIREVSFNPTNDSAFAAGGYDRIISINDLSRKSCALSAVRLDDIIGSVRWGAHNSAITLTTDDGRLFQFDVRASLRKASLFIDSQKLQLYSHCVYGTHYILLGFGDGDIMQVDIRKSLFINGTKDPFVNSIGDILYDHHQHLFLLSGLSEYSLVTNRQPVSSNDRFVQLFVMVL
uniref:Anaphase-promoting complex subunit 4 WD40 domain-containing protein n=1 Tax=Spongospora subterranea TaxID=70186 RepID=A0A0H5QP11_9EUKA|eukprot:CRZ03337.1 hypothetical protein [Spongospora subterranea]